MPLAYFDGNFIDDAALAVPVTDLGFLLGTTVSERLRTFGGKLFRLPEHVQRLARSLEIVGIRPRESLEEIAAAAEQIAGENHTLLAQGDDLSLVVFVTPGDEGGTPRLAVHSLPLPFSTFASLYDTGQPLVIPEIQQTPPECWPPELKCRSRMHYYLADRAARQTNPSARALLLDAQGRVTEASTANIVLASEQAGLISPPQESILPGVSAAVLAELAAAAGFSMQQREIYPADVARAEEVLLCSTSPCITPVSNLNGSLIGDGRPGPVFSQLIRRWSEMVDLDIVAQAKAFSQRKN